jgi:hypothetical protein
MLSTLRSTEAAATWNRDDRSAHQAWAQGSAAEGPGRGQIIPDVDVAVNPRAMERSRLSRPESMTQWSVFGEQANLRFEVHLFELLGRVARGASIPFSVVHSLAPEN